MTTKTPNLSDFHLCQLLGGLTGNSKLKATGLSGDAILETLFTECDNFRAPFYITDTFVCKERFPVYTELLTPSKSALVELLKENFNQTCLVSDAVFKGKTGLFFITLTDDRNKVTEWLAFLKRMDLHTLQINKDYVLMSPIASFIDK